MSWSRSEILEAYTHGEAVGASHMIVAFDSFDYENYPIYVMPGQDPKEHKPSNGDHVDECYDYRLGWGAQVVEHRANHWDPAPAPDSTV